MHYRALGPSSSCHSAVTAVQWHPETQVGCELEFYLLAKAPDRAEGEDLLPLDDSQYCQSASAPGHH
jgi:glutamine synthetase